MSKRKFKFVGTLHQSSQYGEPLPVCGKVYREDYVIDNKPILYYAEHPRSSQIRQEWQEVFDDVKTPPCVGHAVESDKEEKALRYNDGKPQYSLIDLKSLEPMARVLEFGANKYSRDNWKKGMPLSKIIDSMMRHIAALQSGEWLDPESGLPHTGHIQCNALFMGGPNVELDIIKLKENAKT